MRFRAFAASALVGTVLAGCGGEDQSSPEARSTTPPTVESKPVATVPDSAPAILKVYFLQDGKVTVSSRTVVAGPAVARAALVGLLEGVTGEEAARGLRSDIPAGTKLADIAIDDDMTAVVELSESLHEPATAQVVFTLTQFTSVRRVRLEGEEYVREDFEAETPAILVESPLPGDQVTSPLRIDGTANTFEATFNVEVLDSVGTVLGKRFVTATSGSGTRGTFDAAVPFESTHDGPGELVVFELSAEDGSRIHELRIPLELRLSSR
jgi:germination protein M